MLGHRPLFFVFLAGKSYFYQSVCAVSRYCRWPDLSVVSKEGREV